MIGLLTFRSIAKGRISQLSSGTYAFNDLETCTRCKNCESRLV